MRPPAPASPRLERGGERRTVQPEFREKPGGNSGSTKRAPPKITIYIIRTLGVSMFARDRVKAVVLHSDAYIPLAH